ncbi:hypothetical protein [uncultured Akkermansia sp.]|uniref:hypothetical protein n=1 Tax=uncultured Akkermansia sp. TaxID=512294 RepID=UPI00265CD9C8|nr:hypothetical protein [uncultured Akkermansia sp.]
MPDAVLQKGARTFDPGILLKGIRRNGSLFKIKDTEDVVSQVIPGEDRDHHGKEWDKKNIGIGLPVVCQSVNGELNEKKGDCLNV